MHITNKTTLRADRMTQAVCCQEHCIRDLLAHADEDGMCDADREACRLALRWIEAGNGVEVTGPRILPPNHDVDTEVEH